MTFVLCAGGNAWATAYISYTGGQQQASTTISASNVSSGTAGIISWTGTNCSYASSRVNISANGSITFTASTGYRITKIVITSGSSASYYGTWTSSPSVTPTSSSGVTTFDGLNSSSVTVTTSTAFRCTSASNIIIYYEAADLTDPTITFNNGTVRVGQNLNLSTLFSSNSAGTVTYSITAGDSYASIDGSTLTGVAVGSVTVKAAQAAAGNYNAGEASATITVTNPVLSSIAITTAPTKTTYTEGETFDPTGMVVTATYSDASTDNVTASCTYTPSTSTALTTSNTAITVSYTWNEVEKTTTQAITVNEYVQPMEFDINLNNTAFGCVTGRISAEQSLTSNGVVVVAGCTSSASNKTYYDTGHVRFYAESYLKLTAPTGYDITEIVFTANGTWNANITVDIGSYNNSDKTWTGAANEVQFSFAAQNRASKIAITLAKQKTLTSIAVTTSPTKTAYKIGETLDLAGIVVTGTYDDSSTEDVTSKCTFSPSNGATLGTAGNQNVTVTYGGKEATQAITVASVSGLAVKTAPKAAYKDGEELDLSGLVLTATYSDSGTKDITEGYTSSIEDGTELTTDKTSVRFTYYGQYVDQAISVGTLSSLSYNSGTFANTTYTEKAFFDPTGLVVTANYTNNLAEVVDTYTLTPNTETELTTDDNKVTASYTWAGVTKTVDIAITVNEGDKFSVTFDPGTGTCEDATRTETEYQGGVTLPSATCSKTGWTFVGWAPSAVTATETRPATLYKAGESFYPIANTGLYAVYSVEGVGFSQYKRAASVDDVTSASSVAIVTNKDGYILNHELTNALSAPTEENGIITVSDNYLFSLTGNNTEGFTISSTGGKKVGPDATPNSSSKTKVLYIETSITTKWIVERFNNNDNIFVLKIAGSDGAVMQYFTSDWKSYYTTSYSTDADGAMKIYVPKVLYNSNPSTDVVTPDVSFDKGGTTLYLDGTKTYTNTATVTNVDKSITYESSNTDVATVSSDGVVTAEGIGTATITAKVAAELGVNTVGTTTYNVVIKNTTTVAGLKAIASSSTAVDFAADLTDAVVTYVEPTATSKYAYIHDATADIMVYISGGHSLTAGQKINGAVSGQVKAPNQIDQISSINVNGATVTDDGVIPSAEEKTLAYIVANAASLDGKKVTVNAATVSAGMNNATSGGVITDDGGTTTVNIIAPNRLTLNATEIGNFTGFVSSYVSGNNTTYRLNLYEASQYQKTQNVATAQTLTFANNAVALDEVTSALTEFTGQTVSGAHTTVTYSKTDASNIIGDFDTSTGELTLNGTCGTATITATAAAENVVEDGVTTPYTEATKSYTITVSPRYIVTFSVNGIETTVRQATSGATVAVPTPDDIDGHKCVGWRTTTLDPTDDKPSFASIGATVTPTDYDDIYYAVFANQTQTGTGGSYELDYVTDVVSCSGYGTADNVTASDGSKWVVKAYNNSGMQINKSKNSSVKVPTCPGNITSVVVTCSSAGKNAVGFSASDYNGSDISTISYLASGSTSTTQTLDLSEESVNGGYVVPTSAGVAVITHIVVNYGPIISYDDYRTSLPEVEVTIPSSKFLSFCYGRALDFSNTDVKAYKAAVSDDKVTLTKVDVVPSNEGVILYCENPDTYTINVTDKTASDVTGNEMVGVLTRTQVLWNPSTGIYNYILQQGQFNMATDGYLKANRAYLSTSYDVTSSDVRAFTIVFDDDETGIKAIEDEQVNGAIYNLAGQRLNKVQKGINIINGKKVLVK